MFAPTQTREGFFLGESVPVNRRLSDIFLQLHISERSGRGVPKIARAYGRDSYEFRQRSIYLTIPFAFDDGAFSKGADDENVRLNDTHRAVLGEIRNNPNITHAQLMEKLGLGRSAVQNNVSYLRKAGLIRRFGSNKTGYWEVQ